jgi:hypothetical protein
MVQRARRRRAGREAERSGVLPPNEKRAPRASAMAVEKWVRRSQDGPPEAGKTGECSGKKGPSTGGSSCRCVWRKLVKLVSPGAGARRRAQKFLGIIFTRKAAC